MMMERCRMDGYRVMNTWFKKPEAKKVTHAAMKADRLPQGRETWDPAVYGELDLCLTGERWKGMINNIESDTKCGLNSDHFPLKVEVELRLRANRGQNKAAQGKWDFKGANDEKKTGYEEHMKENAASGWTEGKQSKTRGGTSRRWCKLE